MGFEYVPYIGSHIGEYIPELCFEVRLTDPAKYYVQGWKGFFNITGIRRGNYRPGIIVIMNSSEIYNSEVITLQLIDATHRKTCFTIEYSDIANFFTHGGDLISVSVYHPFGIPQLLYNGIIMYDFRKSIVIMQVAMGCGSCT